MVFELFHNSLHVNLIFAFHTKHRQAFTSVEYVCVQTGRIL